jgi:Fe-S cluster assembly protein SufD
MTDFQQQALQLASAQHGPDWLQGLRNEGAKQWQKVTWPTRKNELWKYTSLQSLQKQTFTQWAQQDSDWQDQVKLVPLDATRLVFVNGVFDAAASTELPDGVTLFSQADNIAHSVIADKLGSILNTERHLFASLSNAWAAEGVLVNVPGNIVLEKPVYIVHVSTPQAEPSVASHRILVVLGDNASAEVIEHYVSTPDSQNGFVNALTEIDVGPNAELRHTRISLEQEDLLHIGGVHVNLHRDARLLGFTLAEGSQLKRIDYQVNHRGRGAELRLNGVYLARNQQLVDYHANVEHCVSHCTTHEVFRGIIGDSAHAVFNGRIHIHPDAQKTLAELSNRNLLTSNKAEIDTKPELEIYADDVKCAHGATISQLDATAMYYLQSRGISEQQARVMLSFGFINELLQEIHQPEVQEALRTHLTDLFAQSSSLVAAAASPEPAGE